MNEIPRTQGEILFEQYLASQCLAFEFEKEHAGKSKRPDYTIAWHGQTIVFDVKDFDPPEKAPTGFALRETDIMLGAMYGDSGFTFPVNTSTGVGDASQLKRAFLGRGKMIRPNWTEPQNTTISALITLVRIQPHYLHLLELVREDPRRDNEAEIRNRIPDYDPAFEMSRVIVWHNAVARVPFPTDLFCGAYDTHFGIVRVADGEVQQDVTYEGSAVPLRLKLLKP
jgi:hypothetical protein